MSINTVVGNPGTTIPTYPKDKDRTPIVKKNGLWIDKNIFDGINIGLSKLVGRLSLSSLKLQDGQIHTYSLAMVVTGVISVFILVILG